MTGFRLAILLWAFLASTALAANCDNWAARVVSVQGTVEVSGTPAWQRLSIDDAICAGQTVRVGVYGRAAVRLPNQSVLRLDQNTTLTFDARQPEQQNLLDMLQGAAHFISRQTRALQIRTPFANAAVEGTEFTISVAADEALIAVVEGRVLASNALGSESVAGGEVVRIASGAAPRRAIRIMPLDAAQWAVYYPPVLSLDSNAGVTSGSNALERAAQLLQVGRVVEAEAELGDLPDAQRRSAVALALQSIIALAQNRNEQALDLARQAHARDSASASASIALSYALQAGFDLPGARSVLHDAVSDTTNNALLWARLAELELSMGNLEPGLDAAHKAVDLQPGLGRGVTMLGFAQMLDLNLDAAGETFMRAIEIDQANPLPRLGIALVRIRGGRLTEGREDLETALMLGPRDAIVRSYLGKAYFEERRDDLATVQFNLARELDPNDPTPWFYNAIMLQSQNRPVEAVEELEQAIALNDNRALYRSRFELDEDLASRNVSLGRVYRDLGFEELALRQGGNSLATDPGNSSAHRLLADSYAARPRHEVARVSELLQSQLRQPLNTAPIQPQMAEANLFILRGTGPSSAGLNEYNQLFERNGVTARGDLVVGNDSTWGNDVIVSALTDRTAISAGQFHYESDGFRDNNDQDRDIYNVFIQHRVTARTSVQAEVRHSEFDSGDLTLRFDPDTFLPDLRLDDEATLYRVGLHHRFSPAVDVIVSASYEDYEDSVEDDFLGTRIDIDSDKDSGNIEAQSLIRLARADLVVGAGYADVNREEEVSLSFDIPFPPFTITDVTTESTDVDHKNAYVYANIDLMPDMIATIGASADDFSDELVDEDQFNPKVGLRWRASQWTTVRAAAMRTLNRTLVNEQTIEPTQVAGFNQFYEDGQGTDAKAYGIALDLRMLSNLSGGLEYMYRDLEVPFEQITFSGPFQPPVFSVEDADWDEKIGRAYVYWAAHRNVAVSAEYYYEKLERSEDFSLGIIRSRVHEAPVSVRYFAPNGFFAGATATWFSQSGRFTDDFNQQFSDDDQFWLMDLAAGYRFPGRRGKITFGVRNLFDEEFDFYDSDPETPRIQPDRAVFARISAALD